MGKYITHRDAEEFIAMQRREKAEARKQQTRQSTQRCESGWTGDRCTKRLFHSGPHSNE